jgi:alanine dehydrogenase
VERGAGSRAGFEDAAYQSAGATIAYTREELFTRADLVAAVFPPEPDEYQALLHPGQVIMAFWMLPAGGRESVLALQRCKVSVIGLEAIADASGRAPVLESMSELAGGLAITVGACLLLNAFGGKGILMGGAPGVPPAHVAILGAGVLGRSAARAALGAGAQVMLLDTRMEPLREAVVGSRGLATMLATPANVEKALSFADLVLGRGGGAGRARARGRHAPHVVVDEAPERGARPLHRHGRLLRDVATDFLPEPAYEVDGILHFCVPNLPAAAARSATVALTNALLPYLTGIGHGDLERAVAESGELRRGLYLYAATAPRARSGAPSICPAPPCPGSWGDEPVLLGRDLPAARHHGGGGPARRALGRPRLGPRRVQPPGGARTRDGRARAPTCAGSRSRTS